MIGLRGATTRGPRFAHDGRFIVRLDAPHVLAYYEECLAVAHSRRARLVRRLRRVPGGAFALSGLARPPAPGALRWEASYERAASLLGDRLAGLTLGIVVHDYGGARRGRALYFLFAEEDRTPRAVLKTRALPGSGAILGAEWGALQTLRARLPEGMAGTVPTPLGFAADDEIEAMLMSGVRGRSGYVELLATREPAHSIDRHLALGVDWLSRFQAASSTSGAPMDATSLLQRWRELRQRHCRHDGDDAIGDLLADNGELPRTMAHGDFWVRNVLFADDAKDLTGVVDWEHARSEASPLDDLFQLVTTYVGMYPWSRMRSDPVFAFTQGFVADTRLARAVTAALAQWGTRAGLSAATMRAHFLLHLLERADAAGTDSARGNGTLTRPQWLQCYRMIATADRCVFSG